MLLILEFMIFVLLLVPPNLYRTIILAADGLYNLRIIIGVEGLQIAGIRNPVWEWIACGDPVTPGQDGVARSSFFKPGLVVDKEKGIIFLQHDLLQLLILAGPVLVYHIRLTEIVGRKGHAPLHHRGP